MHVVCRPWITELVLTTPPTHPPTSPPPSLVQAKGTEAGAEPLSDEDMEDADGAVRNEARQRGKRGRGEPGAASPRAGYGQHDGPDRQPGID